MRWNERKKSINFISPDLWPPRASRLQGLTVMQQWVYQMTFRNVDEFKKRLVKSALVCSRTLSTLYILSTNGEIVSVPRNRLCVRVIGLTFLNFFYCRQLKKQTIGSWNVSQSDRNVDKICCCVLFWLTRLTIKSLMVLPWIKMQHFVWSAVCFPEVCLGQKQTLSELGNWRVVWWPAVSGIFVSKI